MAVSDQTAAKIAASAMHWRGKKFEETFKPSNRPVPPDAQEINRNPKKRKGGARRAIIIILVLLLLVAAGAAALVFTGTADVILESFGIPNFLPGAETRSLQYQLEQRAHQLDQREQLLNDREDMLSQRETELMEQSDRLDIREKNLKRQQEEWEAEIEAAKEMTIADILATYSDDKLQSMRQVGAIYSKMDAEAAAAIVSELYDAQQIAAICYSMQPQAAALMLEKLEPELAAEVTAILAG
jgi:flagellar motility protein MotE (MotC chaperone)